MLLISDTGPIISLLLIKKFDILEKLFPNIVIPKTVYNELLKHTEISEYQDELNYLQSKVKSINSYFTINGIDIGETEAILLCNELKADFLLIDDKKAREKAELFNINCIGTLGLLYLAHKKCLIKELRPYFIELHNFNRYFSKQYLNYFLEQTGEQKL